MRVVVDDFANTKRSVVCFDSPVKRAFFEPLATNKLRVLGTDKERGRTANQSVENCKRLPIIHSRVRPASTLRVDWNSVLCGEPVVIFF